MRKSKKEINNYEVHTTCQEYQAFKLPNQPVSPIVELRVLRILEIKWLVQFHTTIMKSKGLGPGKEALVATETGLGLAEKRVPRKDCGLVLVVGVPCGPES